MYILKITTLIALLFVGSPLKGQEKAYTVDLLVEQVLQNNRELQKMLQQVGMSQADVKQANSAFLPSVSLSETFTTTTDPMLAFGTKLGQSSISSTDFNPALLNNPDRISNFNTQIEVQQPIFNWDGLLGRKAAKYMLQSTELNHQWATEMLSIQAKNMYFSLVLAYKAENATQQALKVAESSLNTSQHLFEQGLITKADLMGAQLYATQSQQRALQASHQIEHLNEQLLQMIGSDEDFVIAPTDSLPIHAISYQSIQALSLSDDRSDLMARSLQAEASTYNYNAKKGGFIPRLNAFGSYRMNDTQAFGSNADNYLLGIQMKWDLFAGGKHLGALQRAQYEKRYAQLHYEESKTEARRMLSQLKNDFQLAEEQIKLTALSKQQAQEIYKMRADRYAEGLEKTTDLIADESKLLQKEIEWLQSQHRYLQLLFQLELAVSQDLIN